MHRLALAVLVVVWLGVPLWPGKQVVPRVTMRVCEAELEEGSNSVVLLESAEVLLRELLRELRAYDGAPSLHIDNSAAGGLLSSAPGSWRTRHLKIRFASAMERIARGCLQVVHTPGHRQLADPLFCAPRPAIHIYVRKL